MRELAGSVPTRARCESTTKADATEFRGAKCTFPDKDEVSYYQVPSVSDAEKQIQQMNSTNSGEVKTSDWSGGGLAGKVYYMDLGNGFGMLFFIANGKPLYGQIFSPVPETPGAPTERQDIESYFDQIVKPGSG